MIEKLPTLVLVGRPNVGKSTLFNYLTGTRDALVADLPGLTRDRQYGTGKFEQHHFVVVDTGGLMPESQDPLAELAEDQARMALDEADHILFVVDSQAGLTPSDSLIARELRKRGKPLTLLANKAEGREKASAQADFFQLGLGDPLPISAEKGQGVAAVLRKVLADFAPVELPEEDEEGPIRVAIIGRPNVGKSTLINRLLGEDRVLAANVPGTTRDAISVAFEYDGQAYQLIDTAGVRRRARVWEGVEKLSIVKTLQAIERAHVVIAIIDAQGDIGEQDARLLGLVAQRGRAMILAVNKWDGLSAADRERAKYQVELKMPFLDYAPTLYISALHGSGLREVMEAVQVAHAATMRELPTAEVTRVLEEAVQAHQPPAVLGRRIKLRYAHQGGKNPPRIVVHGNQTDKLPEAYKRYLANRFRAAFKLVGVPLLLSFKTSDNPYKDKKNQLSGRQIKKRRRLMARVKGR
ncbi:ribosome biogenesis GTPase Der [Sinimarinibacterium sp. NLF-5-8]|uniref:ribosome biogenesis GTPase Der n=1 Tax=Sinimarinibacterium sp. NLF-5-8 TaxID=2698684 RepID=UPI00137C075F|nr:ribosome biogenesis GTPase Der [Sinimarinibacterium sp. NLF-5-8]QHS11445.1 ribosome biogenesis GTPase Der [Sinimarinibacterium sp. NLF-5-8]